MMEYKDKFLLRVLIIFLAMLIYQDIYLILLPLTKFLSFLFLKLVDNTASILNNSLVVGGKSFKIISACVALPAYYLLLFLTLTTKDLSFKKSCKLLIVGSILIITMNIIRIDFLILVFIGLGKSWFDYIHLFLWKFVSGIYVALVWIFLTKKYNIQSIPIYDDFKYLYSKSLFRKKNQKKE
jgi:exosortase/archaeosortase family protein